MDQRLIHSFLAFIAQTVPSFSELITMGPVMLALSWIQLALVIFSKAKWTLSTGLSRKLFHILVFCSAALLRDQFSLAILCLYGVCVSGWVGLAILRGEGDPAYEALARPSDAPHRTQFVLQPWLATLVGGLLAQFCFKEASLAGFWVVGLADAAAEPVGLLWGRHPYSLSKIPWLKNSRRTWEGSFAVAVISTVIFIGFTGGEYLPLAVIGGIAMALIESLSPHGADNLSLQLGASAFLAMALS